MPEKALEDMTDEEYGAALRRNLDHIGYCVACGGGPLALEEVHVHPGSVWHSNCCDARLKDEA